VLAGQLFVQVLPMDRAMGFDHAPGHLKTHGFSRADPQEFVHGTGAALRAMPHAFAH